MTPQETNNITKPILGYYDIAANASGRLIVKILDLQGKLAKTIYETLADGVEMFSIKLDDLKEGSYVLNIFNEGNFIKAVRYTKN